MAVLMELVYLGVTAEQYDAVDLHAGSRANPAIAGLLSHCVVITEEGLRMVDVWESRAALDAFLSSLGPLAREAGFPEPAGPPCVSEVHHFSSKA